MLACVVCLALGEGSAGMGGNLMGWGFVQWSMEGLILPLRDGRLHQCNGPGCSSLAGVCPH